MNERERIVVTGTLAVLVVVWLGFLVHRSPRFAGSGVGAAFGIAGALLMLVPLAYPIIKRVPFLLARVSRHVSMASLLAAHVYAGIAGALLGILHTGHKFDSALGVALTTVMLLVVVSGFAVRYLLTYVRDEIKDQLLLLQTARGDLDSAWGILENTSYATSSPLPSGPTQTRGANREITRIADYVADLEYSIRMHEFFKRWFARTLNAHIVLSVSFYLLLALHIGSGIYFGLRWLP